MEITKLNLNLERNINHYKQVLARKGYQAVLSALKQSINILEKTEKRLDEAKLAKGALQKGSQTGLAGRTSEELYEMARELEIKGRSKMNKGQLRDALRRRLYH